MRDVNAMVLGKGLELLVRIINNNNNVLYQHADDTALVADSEEKLCRRVSEFGNVCKRRKLRLYGEPLEEVDCFKHLGSQDAADGRCEKDVVDRINGSIKFGER